MECPGWCLGWSLSLSISPSPSLSLSLFSRLFPISLLSPLSALSLSPPSLSLLSLLSLSLFLSLSLSPLSALSLSLSLTTTLRRDKEVGGGGSIIDCQKMMSQSWLQIACPFSGHSVELCC